MVGREHRDGALQLQAERVVFERVAHHHGERAVVPTLLVRTRIETSPCRLSVALEVRQRRLAIVQGIGRLQRGSVAIREPQSRELLLLPLAPWAALVRLRSLALRDHVHEPGDARPEASSDFLEPDLAILDDVVQQPRHHHLVVEAMSQQDHRNVHRMHDVGHVGSLPRLRPVSRRRERQRLVDRTGIGKASVRHFVLL